MPSVVFPRRGEVYVVDFNPTRDAEIQKTRPALILQNDVGNRHSPLTIVAAITSTIPATTSPFKVLVSAPEGGLGRDSLVLLNQIRSIDQSRLIRRLGKLKPVTMAKVDRALKVSLGLIEF
jgi:mRNA interferase MazF